MNAQINGSISDIKQLVLCYSIKNFSINTFDSLESCSKVYIFTQETTESNETRYVLTRDADEERFLANYILGFGQNSKLIFLYKIPNDVTEDLDIRKITVSLESLSNSYISFEGEGFSYNVDITDLEYEKLRVNSFNETPKVQRLSGNISEKVYSNKNKIRRNNISHFCLQDFVNDTAGVYRYSDVNRNNNIDFIYEVKTTKKGSDLLLYKTVNNESIFPSTFTSEILFFSSLIDKKYGDSSINNDFRVVVKKDKSLVAVYSTGDVVPLGNKTIQNADALKVSKYGEVYIEDGSINRYLYCIKNGKLYLLSKLAANTFCVQNPLNTKIYTYIKDTNSIEPLSDELRKLFNMTKKEDGTLALTTSKLLTISDVNFLQEDRFGFVEDSLNIKETSIKSLSLYNYINTISKNIFILRYKSEFRYIRIDENTGVLKALSDEEVASGLKMNSSSGEIANVVSNDPDIRIVSRVNNKYIRY